MYSTLMVYLDPYRDNTGLLQVTAMLADRFDAAVVGITSARRGEVAYNAGVLAGTAIDLDREEVDEAIEATQQAFRTVMQRRGRQLEWCAAVGTDPQLAVIQQERNADLVIRAANDRSSAANGSSPVDFGHLVMRSARPLLIVPAASDTLTTRCVLVGWNDAREARRAVSDALPLLKTADRVIVAQVARNDHTVGATEAVADVVRWLKRHGVRTSGRVDTGSGSHAHRLQAIVSAESVDLLVAGAYGHLRLREWMLGGVTRDLLLRGELPVLLSH